MRSIVLLECAVLVVIYCVMLTDTTTAMSTSSTTPTTPFIDPGAGALGPFMPTEEENSDGLYFIYDLGVVFSTVIDLRWRRVRFRIVLSLHL